MAKKPKEQKQAPSKLANKLKEIEKMWGSGTVIQLGDREPDPIEVIPTGSIMIDNALGIGGLPRGRIAEVFSPKESAGKTTFALSVARECQLMGGKVAIIDSEQAMDLIYAKKIGVNTKELLFSQPDTAEQALSIVDKLVESEEIDLIIVDSVAGLVPKSVLEGDVGSSHMADLARLMSQELNKIKSKVRKSNCTILFTNQMRQNINTMGYGEKYVTSGGTALKFYASVRIKLARIKTSKDSDGNAYSIIVKADIVKNKCSAPYKTAEFAIYFTDGLSKYSDVYNSAIKFGVLEKKGAWISYEGNNIGQGEAKTLDYLKENNDIFEKIKSEVLQILGDE